MNRYNLFRLAASPLESFKAGVHKPVHPYEGAPMRCYCNFFIFEQKASLAPLWEHCSTPTRDSLVLVPSLFRSSAVVNRPFPSSLVPLFQSESKCETILMKMTLICARMKLHAELIFIRKVSHLDSF